MQTLIKVVIVLTIVIHISGCGAILNLNKPRLRDNRAIANAYNHHVIKFSYRYMAGDVLLTLIPVVGLLTTFFGSMISMAVEHLYFPQGIYFPKAITHLAMPAATFGWLIPPFALLFDYIGNYNYRIIDQEKYNAWKKEYLKELEQHKTPV